jgi:hypothetical protein
MCRPRWGLRSLLMRPSDIPNTSSLNIIFYNEWLRENNRYRATAAYQCRDLED